MIADGAPIEVLRALILTLAIPRSGDHFALEMRGDSMIEAGIYDNDALIIRSQDNAKTGEVVLALIDGKGLTLKRLRKRGASIALEAANPAYAVRIFGPGQGEDPGQVGEFA
jgi:repressor LexA